MVDKPTIILLSGTPASGKDTVTEKLHQINMSVELFKKHKFGVGGKKDNTYIHVSEEAFDQLVKSNGFIQYHQRYGRGYGVSQEELERLFVLNVIPVIHVGKPENLTPLLQSPLYKVINVLLTASRESTQSRLTLRHHNDIAEQAVRLKAYDEEIHSRSDLANQGCEIAFNITIDTDKYSAAEAAAIINDRVQ